MQKQRGGGELFLLGISQNFKVTVTVMGELLLKNLVVKYT